MRQRWLQAAAILIGWSLWGVFNATRLRLVVDEFSWAEALEYGLPDALIWAALTPLIVFLARRVTLQGRHAFFVVLIHLLLAAALGTVHVAIDTLQIVIRSTLSGDPTSFSFLFGRILRHTIHINTLVYLAIVGITRYVDYARRMRDRERHDAELRAQLSEARLDALRAQLRPHFLFNALHTVSALMEDDPATARTVVRKLARLLRRGLDAAGAHEIPLSEELENVRAYLEIEQVRFADRLSVRVRSDEDSLTCAVPGFILQPLVENAVRHGIGRRTDGGRIDVEAVSRNGRLELRVQDNGPGLDLDDQRSGGVGLANTRARLEALYPGNHEFELREFAEGGALARISIPRQRFAGEASA